MALVLALHLVRMVFCFCKQKHSRDTRTTDAGSIWSVIRHATLALVLNALVAAECRWMSTNARYVALYIGQTLLSSHHCTECVLAYWTSFYDAPVDRKSVRSVVLKSAISRELFVVEHN